MKSAILLSVFVCAAFGLRLPLLGNFSETFFWFVSVSVGSQSFTVTVDTGSSDFLIPQLGCGSCFGGDPKKYYNGTNHFLGCSDNSLKCLTCAPFCNFSVTYGGALTENATAVHDLVSLGSPWSGKVVFGATYNVIQPQRRRVESIRRSSSIHKRQDLSGYPEGIWGLAYSNLNSLGVNTLLDSLKLQNPVLRNVFGLCFRGVGGQMSLGEVPSSWSSSEWQYTPVTKFGFWQVQFEDFVVANVSLGHSPIFNNPGIVDSGTPFLTIPPSSLALFKQLLLANCSHSPLVGICNVASNATLFEGVCFSMSVRQISAWPSVFIKLAGGTTLEVSAHMFLIPMFNCNPGQVSLAIVSDPQFTVIGGNVLLHFASVFDKDNSRVGFVRSNGTCK